jgi:hypothetical protein
MFWGVWLILGLGFGWWAHVIFGADPVVARERNAEQPPFAEYARQLAGWLLRAGGRREVVEQAADTRPADAPAEPAPRLPAPTRLRWLNLLAFFVFAGAALLVADEPYDENLPELLRWFVALLLKPRLLALASGGLLGWWASCYRHPLGARLDDFYSAFLGSETKSSWALQSLVAIIALLLVVLAVKPDLLDKLESFKAGDVEAKFASISNATREARIVTNDLTKKVTIKEWLEFKKNFREGARNDALEFDESEIKETRRQIRNELFEYYVEPLTQLLSCLDEDNRIDRIRRDPEFVRLTVILRNKILKEARDGSGTAFKENDWFSLFDMADAQMRKVGEIIEKEVPDDIRKDKCDYVTATKFAAAQMMQGSRERAEKLGQKVRDVVLALKSLPDEREYKLSFLDPYFIGAVSDLIAMTFNHTEKADFLTQVKASYPRKLNYIQPGIINLYYYLSDAKLKSDTPWPLDEELQELDYAMQGSDYLINASREKANRIVRARVHFPRKPKITYDRIVHVYFRNKFIFLSRYLEIFCQHALAGETLEEHERFKWAQFYKQAESVLNLKELGPSLELDGVSPSIDRDVAEWKNIDVSKEVTFDTRVALALSAVLLTENRNRSSQQACVVARSHAHRASELLLQLDQTEAGKSKLRGYLSQITAHIKASCPDSVH